MNNITGPRFTTVGPYVAVHYPTGWTLGATHLDALTHALRILRWHAANALWLAANGGGHVG